MSTKESWVTDATADLGYTKNGFLYQGAIISTSSHRNLNPKFHPPLIPPPSSSMQLTIALIASAAIASTVLAESPWPAGGRSAAPSATRPHQADDYPWSGCLSEATASDIVTKYTYLLENPTGADFNSTANTLLTDDFVVWSDSIQFLGGNPVSLLSRTT